MSAPSGGQSVKLNSQTMEQLLRPAFEEGQITFHDFERAKEFASASRKRSLWPSSTGCATAAWAIYYGIWHRKRPWPMLSMFMITPIAFAVGSLPGAFAQVLAYRRFEKGLDDSKSVYQALATNLRLQQSAVARTRDSEATRDDFPSNSEGSSDNMSSNNQDDPEGLQGRWAELRKASASVSNSTWDKIRQSHERPASSQPPQSGPSPNSAESPHDRQAEQAKFDALLDAERKMSS